MRRRTMRERQANFHVRFALRFIDLDDAGMQWKLGPMMREWRVVRALGLAATLTLSLPALEQRWLSRMTFPSNSYSILSTTYDHWNGLQWGIVGFYVGATALILVAGPFFLGPILDMLSPRRAVRAALTMQAAASGDTTLIAATSPTIEPLKERVHDEIAGMSSSAYALLPKSLERPAAREDEHVQSVRALLPMVGFGILNAAAYAALAFIAWRADAAHMFVLALDVCIAILFAVGLKLSIRWLGKQERMHFISEIQTDEHGIRWRHPLPVPHERVLAWVDAQALAVVAHKRYFVEFKPKPQKRNAFILVGRETTLAWDAPETPSAYNEGAASDALLRVIAAHTGLTPRDLTSVARLAVASPWRSREYAQAQAAFRGLRGADGALWPEAQRPHSRIVRWAVIGAGILTIEALWLGFAFLMLA